MITKNVKYKSVILSSEKLLEIANILEESVKKKEYHTLSYRLRLKNDETYTFTNTKDLRLNLDDFFDKIQSFDFRLSSQPLDIVIDSWSLSVDLTVSSEDRGVMLDKYTIIDTKIRAEKSHNWMVHSIWLAMLAPTLIASVIYFCVFLLFGSKWTSSHLGITLLLVAVLMVVSIPISFLVEKVYPITLIHKDNNYSGRNIKKDWYKFLAVILIPGILSLIFR
jgi:hypothetical protein